MNNFKKFIILNILLMLCSCGTIKEGFTNQKKNSSDEFLVEKKSPLVMPPSYGELPIPSNEKNVKKNLRLLKAAARIFSYIYKDRYTICLARYP